MDKNKIIEAAAKLVAKGAYDKAIKEYQKILEVDAKDVRILQKMGELYQKKNDNAQAAVYFTKVAESYATDGFFLKAVALYKQVLKLDPSLMDVNIKLAELHQQLQLMGEAMAYYHIVANHYDKAGDTKRSLDVLKTMVDLDPDNMPSRVKLADLYLREKMTAEAVAEFQRAAEHLKRQGAIDDYVRVVERISSVEPKNLALAKELAEIYLQRNDQKRALAKLKICYDADPRDVDTLRLLAVAFQGLGQTSKTVALYRELARAYEAQNMYAEAEQVWGQVQALDPNDPDLVARNNPSPSSPTQMAPNLSAPPPPVSSSSSLRPVAAPAAASGAPTSGTSTTGHQQASSAAAPSADRPRVDNVAKLLTETDVYVKYGLHDKALEHLRKIFANDPENIDAHEKAYAIYVASNNAAQAFEQLLNVLRLHTRRSDVERAQPYLATILQENPGHPEVPAFLATLRLAGSMPNVAGGDPSASLPDDAILVDSSDDEVIVADEHDEVLSAELEVADASAYEPEPLADDEPMSMVNAGSPSDAAIYQDGEPDDGSQAEVVSDFDDENPTTLQGERFAQLADEGEVEEVVEEPGLEHPTGTVSLDDRVGSWELGEEEEARTEGSGVVAPKIPVTTEPMYRAAGGAQAHGSRPAAPQPLPTLPDEELYEDENMFNVPTRVGDAPGHQEPAHYDLTADAGEAVEEAVEVPPEEEPASEECDEATFFIEQGLFDEAREILETVLIAYPEHQRASMLLSQLEAAAAGVLGADPASTTGKGAFDLAAELANELGDMGGEALSGPPSDEYQVSVDEVFSEFKKGLEKVVKPEDVETHYDLGIAYKEMGLIDDAISEFTVARKGCLGKRKEIDCLSMIGILQLEKGDFAAAIDAYQQGLQSEHASAEVEKASRYELAFAYESAGEAGKALGQYLRVQGLDPSYREIAQHIERLSATTTPEDDGPPAPPTKPPQRGGPTGSSRKVGYV